MSFLAPIFLAGAAAYLRGIMLFRQDQMQAARKSFDICR